MSLEPAWPGVIGAILLPALGHLYHFILAVNVTSGTGVPRTVLARIRLVLCRVLLGSAGFSSGSTRLDPWWTWAWPLRAYALLCVASGGLVWPLCSLILECASGPRESPAASERLDLTQGAAAPRR